MWCPTRKLIDYIRREYIGKDRLIKGIDFLYDVLGSTSPYYNQLTQLKSQAFHLEDLRRMGTLRDRTPYNEVNYNFLNLLAHIEYNEKSKIFVVANSELERNISGLEPGRSPYQYPSSRTSEASQKEKKNKNYTSTFLFLGLIIVLFIYLLTDQSSNGEQNKSPIENDDRYLESGNELYEEADIDEQKSPLEQVTTWSRDANSSNFWAVFLRGDCETLDEAKNIQNAFKRSRDIDIMQLSNGRFYLFIFADTKFEAKQKWTKEVQKEWNRSRVIPIDKCNPTLVTSKEYFECF